MVPNVKVARLGVLWHLFNQNKFQVFGLRCSLAGSVVLSFFESRSNINQVLINTWF